MVVNVHEAKTHLSRLLERALAGEEVIIARAGCPIVKLMPIEMVAPVLGSAAGTIVFHPGWNDSLTDEEMSLLFEQ